MKAGRLWLSIYGAGFVVCFALLWITLLTPIAYGELTRIGRISETEFAARKPAPIIDATYLVDTPIESADVLVIGDSFSIRFAWQSELVKAGYRVVTTHWDQTGPLCADFPEWLRRSGFTGRFVVIESIERLLPGRLEQAATCAHMTSAFHPVPRATQLFADSALTLPHSLNWDADWATGWLTYVHTREIKGTDKKLEFGYLNWGALIVARPLAEGCKEFSNRLCRMGLFLVDDERTPVLSVAAAEFMDRFRARAVSTKVVWMVIPNKTTVYLEQNHAFSFAREFNERHLGPDLFALTANSRQQVMDFYSPNDTHFSPAGYQAAGGWMAQALSKIDK